MFEVWEYIENDDFEMIAKFAYFKDAEEYFKKNCRNYYDNDFIEVRYKGRILLYDDYED